MNFKFKIHFLFLIFILIFGSSAFCKNIAVIPFTNITKDESKDWIGAGFGSTLTTKLGKVKSINLIEREQLQKILDELKFQYSGYVDNNTAVKTGKIFGADVLVLGEFQIMDNTLRVNARFVSVQSGKIIDTAEITGELKNIFTLQDEIAFKLIDSINIVLAEKEKEEIKINPTENLMAYQWYSKGAEVYSLKLYDSSVEYFTKAIELDKNFADAYIYRGNTYADKGDYASAIADYNKAIQLDITGECETGVKGAAYYNRGIAYDDKGNYDNAIADYTKAIELNPQFAIAYINRGNTYFKKSDYDKAIADYNKAIQLNPKLADSYNNRGLVYAKKSDYDKAIADYNKAIQLNPQDADAYCNRGNAYSDKGNYDSAIADYNKAIQLNPQYASAYYNRGIAYEGKGNCTKANQDYKKACSLGYNDACSYKCP